MVECPECNKEVSSQAITCPSCGHPLKTIFQPNSFRNPINGYVEQVPKRAWLWTLIFGPFYLLLKSVWVHALSMAVVSLVFKYIASVSFKLHPEVSLFFLLGWFFINWVVYPVKAKDLIRIRYLQRGWQPL